VSDRSGFSRQWRYVEVVLPDEQPPSFTAALASLSTDELGAELALEKGTPDWREAVQRVASPWSRDSSASSC
jgi:hypothetical protein